VSGCVAWWRRPTNAIGVLMVAVGLSWNVVALTAVDASIPFTVGLAFQIVPFAFFAHLLLVFPTGRLERGLPLLLVVVAYLEATAVWIAHLLFRDLSDLDCDCPDSALQIWSSEAAADAIETVHRTVGIVALLVLVAVLAQRWRRASAPSRRLLAPVLATGGLAGAFLVVALVLEQLSADPLANLTPREREVLELMAEGRSNHGIAERLVVTERAVEKHVTSIFGKLRLPPTAEDHRRVLAVLAFLSQ